MPVAAPEKGFTQEQLNLIRKTVAKDCNDRELELFLYTAKRTGLDPLLKQIYAIKRAGRLTIQVGIDGFRLVADRTGRYAPGKAPVYEYRPDDEERRIPWKVTVTVKKLVGECWHDVEASAYWREYALETGMWNKMPHNQLAKCAESLAIRKAFPADLSGIYTFEEMEQAKQQDDAVYDAGQASGAWEEPETPTGINWLGQDDQVGNTIPFSLRMPVDVGNAEPLATTPPPPTTKVAAKQEEIAKQQQGKPMPEAWKRDTGTTGGKPWIPEKFLCDFLDKLLSSPKVRGDKSYRDACTEMLHGPKGRNPEMWAKGFVGIANTIRKAGGKAPAMPKDVKEWLHGVQSDAIKDEGEQ